jgi:hypothetical protein
MSTGARTYEFFFQWESDGAGHGTLRITDTSGIVETQVVSGTRYKDMIVVDRPGTTDLVDHMALIRDQGGKRAIQQGGASEPWSACQ